MRLSYMLGLVFVAVMRAAVYPAPIEGDWIAKNFKFTVSGYMRGVISEQSVVLASADARRRSDAAWLST